VNGSYTITDVKPRSGSDEFVVLAHNPAAAQPYVTWRTIGDGVYYWGHYTVSEDAARVEFRERAAGRL
jgi:hypothetical protein